MATAQEVVESGNKGTVTLTITITTKTQGDSLVMVDEKVSRTVPKANPKGAYFYAVDGDLHRDDPRQAPLNLRAVDTATSEARIVPSGHEERVAR